MSAPEIWTPNAVPKHDPNEKIVVLEHAQTHRLFFLVDGPFARTIAKQGFLVHEVQNAAEFDAWGKKIMQQERERDEHEDYLQACRVDERRKKLRDELHHRLLFADPKERMVIKATLNALEVIRRQKERVRESYFARWASEDSNATLGEDLAKKILTNG